jgi:hypothetical protein
MDTIIQVSIPTRDVPIPPVFGKSHKKREATQIRERAIRGAVDSLKLVGQSVSVKGIKVVKFYPVLKQWTIDHPGSKFTVRDLTPEPKPGENPQIPDAQQEVRIWRTG